MSLKSKFIKNTGMVGISKIFENIISYLIIVLISRFLGAEGLGQYSFMFAFVGIFFVFADLGLYHLMIKDLSKNFRKVDKYISNIWTLKTIISIICFLVYLIVIFFINKNEILIPLILVGLIQIVTIFENFYFSILRIKQKGKEISLALLSERIAALIGAFFVLYYFKSLILFVLVLLVSHFIKAIISFLYARKYFKYSFELNLSFLKSLIKKSYPFLLIGAFALIYVRLDTIMLSFMKSDAIVGFYNAGYKLINVLNLIPFVFLTFGFPLFSKFFYKRKESFKILLEKMIKYSLIIILPIVVGVFFVGRRILEFIYDFNSIEAAIAFNILIVAEVFVFLTTIMGTSIASADKQKVFAKIAGFGALLNIVLNIALIPKYSLYGAGIATLATYLFMFVWMFAYIKKELIDFKFFKYLILPLLGCLVMGVVLNFILSLHLLLIILIGGGVYFGFVGIFMKKIN